VQHPQRRREKIRVFLEIQPNRPVTFQAQRMRRKGIGPRVHPAIREHFSVGLAGNGILKSVARPEKGYPQNGPVCELLENVPGHKSGQNRYQVPHGCKDGSK
jgi:hypothetical protein